MLSANESLPLPSYNSIEIATIVYDNDGHWLLHIDSSVARDHSRYKGNSKHRSDELRTKLAGCRAIVSTFEVAREMLALQVLETKAL